MAGSLKKSKVLPLQQWKLSGGTFENNGSTANPTITRQCRSGGMSEWKAVHTPPYRQQLAFKQFKVLA